MEELPEELTIDILSRLAVKTIIHCKCVCKKWRNLVSDSCFINLHLSRSSPTGLIIHDNPLMNMEPGDFKWVEIEDKVNHHRLHPTMTLDLNLAPVLKKSLIHQRGSVNGLICLWQRSRKLDNTYICNPITREIMVLPASPRYCKRIIFYRFGVNSVTGEYKVVRMFYSNGNKLSRLIVLEAEVYTLGTGQWRSLGRVPYLLNGFNELCVPSLNNHFHWIVSDEEDDAPEKICTFDLDKETFQLFPSPPSEAIGEIEIQHQSLAVVKGCLCKLETYVSQFTIWVMKEYGIKKSWHKEVQVINRGVSFNENWLISQPIYLIEGLKDGSILIVSRDYKLLACYPKSGTIEDTQILDHCISVLTYRPSFLKLQKFDSERVHMF